MTTQRTQHQQGRDKASKKPGKGKDLHEILRMIRGENDAEAREKVLAQKGPKIDSQGIQLSAQPVGFRFGNPGGLKRECPKNNCRLERQQRPSRVLDVPL